MTNGTMTYVIKVFHDGQWVGLHEFTVFHDGKTKLKFTTEHKECIGFYNKETAEYIVDFLQIKDAQIFTREGEKHEKK